MLEVALLHLACSSQNASKSAQARKSFSTINMGEHALFKVNQNVILVDPAGKVLILEQKGRWMLPGGRVETGESWLAALQREVREETGITEFSVERPLSADISDSGNTYIVVFLCRVSGAPSIRLSSEHEASAWVDQDAINSYNFWHPNIKDRILLAWAQNDILRK